MHHITAAYHSAKSWYRIRIVIVKFKFTFMLYLLFASFDNASEVT